MSTLSVDTIQGKTTAGTVAMPSGHVIQTVDFTYGTQVGTQSTGYVDTGISAVITPKFNNSKIYVTGFIHCRIYGEHDHGVSFKMRRHIGGTPTDIYTATTTYEHYFYDGTANTTYHDHQTRFPMFVVDTPNTTSECTYSYQYASMRTDNNNVTYIQVGGTPSHGFIMEIKQ